MTVLPELEDQLVRAAGTLARRDRLRTGARLGGSIALAAGVALVGLVVLVFASTRGRAPQRKADSALAARSALKQAAGAAGAGTATPSLRAGQTWYTRAVELSSSQEFPLVPAPKAGTVAPNARSVPGNKIDFSRIPLQKWITSDGQELEAGNLGPGSASSGIPSQSPGFGDWDPDPAYVSSFPVTPAGVLSLLPRIDRSYAYTGSFTALAEIASLLADEPLRPAARAAVFQATAMLPGLRYLGKVSDPLGRSAVAVAADESRLGPFDLPVHPQRYRFELIFDPTTGAVLGSRTIALDPLPIAHIALGAVLFSWAYTGARVSPQASLPAVLRRALQRPGAIELAVQRVSRSPACRIPASASCRRARRQAILRAQSSGRGSNRPAHP